MVDINNSILELKKKLGEYTNKIEETKESICAYVLELQRLEEEYVLANSCGYIEKGLLLAEEIEQHTIATERLNKSVEHLQNAREMYAKEVLDRLYPQVKELQKQIDSKLKTEVVKLRKRIEQLYTEKVSDINSIKEDFIRLKEEWQGIASQYIQQPNPVSEHSKALDYRTYYLLSYSNPADEEILTLLNRVKGVV